MKILYSILVMALLVLSVMPMVIGTGASGSLGGGIGVEVFEPVVWQCGERILRDDDIQPWRITGDSIPLDERNSQYIFEGEQYQVDVVVFDKNKIDDVTVDLTLEGEQICELVCPSPGQPCVEDCVTYDDITENCEPIDGSNIFSNCNARYLEEKPTWDPDTMQGFRCTLDHVLDSEHMYGIYDIKVRAVSALTDEEGEYVEVERMFFNPIVSLSVDGDLDFSDVRPGTASYSTVLLENTGEGGVILDMFITGKDWPSADINPQARCQNVDPLGNEVGGLVNYIPLGAFRYYTQNGAYSTRNDAQIDMNTYNAAVQRNKDAEGYVNIHKRINPVFNEDMFDETEIIQAGGPVTAGVGYRANLLHPGNVGMSVTFRLELPEPCYGNFESETDGSIFFWGEVI